MAQMPGYIKLTKAAVRARYPDVDARIVSHIEGWRDSVEVGTVVPIFEMLVYNVQCACPPGGWVHTKKCQGYSHKMPLEIVKDHVFPEAGVCGIKGVEGVLVQGPLTEQALGRLHMVKRVA